jgi:hypothetical protein
MLHLDAAIQKRDQSAGQLILTVREMPHRIQGPPS